MLYALTEEGQRIKAFRNGRALCPNCNSVVIAKCGDFMIWHWAHDSIANCDTWNYEPKTGWHVNWQDQFEERQREVFIKKNSQCHIADVRTDDGLIIEFQNSPISSTEISKREEFYGRMVWIINSQEFIGNITFYNYQTEFKNLFFSYIANYSPKDLRCFAILVPKDDIHNRILPAVQQCGFKRDFDEQKGEYWFNRKNRYQQPLDKPIADAFSAYLLDKKLNDQISDKNKHYTKFRWLYLRKSWTSATKPLIIDLNNGFLFWIKKVNAGGHGYGEIFRKEKFLNQYS